MLFLHLKTIKQKTPYLSRSLIECFLSNFNQLHYCLHILHCFLVLLLLLCILSFEPLILCLKFYVRHLLDGTCLFLCLCFGARHLSIDEANFVAGKGVERFETSLQLLNEVFAAEERGDGNHTTIYSTILFRVIVGTTEARGWVARIIVSRDEEEKIKDRILTLKGF